MEIWKERVKRECAQRRGRRDWGGKGRCVEGEECEGRKGKNKRRGGRKGGWQRETGRERE